jgi:hypothetical protein
MKPTAKPIRSTIFWGLISGLSFIPLCAALTHYLFWPEGVQVSIWMLLAGYGVMLCRWAQKPLRSIMAPLVLLFLAAFLLRSTSAFLFMTLVMLTWIRSGICFNKRSSAKRLGAEIVLGLATGLLISGAVPGVTLAGALGVWLFFLIQALYFVVFDDHDDTKVKSEVDPFEKAKMGAEKILSNGIPFG